MTHKVLIVEDTPETQHQLIRAVEEHPQLTLACATSSVAQARQFLAQDTPYDAALIDLGLGDGNGIDIIAEAHSRNPDAQILVVTVFGDEKHVLSAIEAGAVGYLLKEQEIGPIGDAIVRVMAGESPISPSIARHLLKRFQKPTESECEDDIKTVSPRETEVLTMIVKGFTYKEIARSLNVSVNTITTHIQHIYRKLSVNSRGEAAYEAIQLGIVVL